MCLVKSDALEQVPLSFIRVDRKFSIDDYCRVITSYQRLEERHIRQMREPRCDEVLTQVAVAAQEKPSSHLQAVAAVRGS